MAFNFNSGQFNKESTPKHLGNWEVPRWAPTRARPLEMRPDPKPICDINGHFLPGAPRGSSRCFGHFTGTWDLPRKITREVAQQLAKEPPEGRFSDWLNPRIQRPKAAAAAVRMRGGKRAKGHKEESKTEPLKAQTFQLRQCPYHSHHKHKKGTEFENQEENKEVRESENNIPEICDKVVENDKEQDPLNLQSKKEPVDDDGHSPYIPGSLTELNNRHESHDILVKEAVEQIYGPQENDADKFWRKVAENAKKNVQANTEMKYDKKSQTPKLPYVDVSQNYQFARKMHVGNLEHQPLPDTLGYRNLTKIGEHRDSDVIIKPYAIGWKGYGASGPTCCTKMRVHRPKTCDSKKTDSVKDENKQRPSTSAPDLGGQYKKPMSLMDLAICWDFRPDDRKNEPKPSKHIDGSNGSKAPAVFTMVHTPNKEVEGTISHANPIFNQNQVGEDFGRHSVPYFEKDMTKEKSKASCDVQHCPQHINSNGNGSRSGSSSRKSSNHSVRKSHCDGIHGCGTPSDSNSKSNHNGNPDKLQPIKDAREEDIVKHGFKVNRNRHSLDSYDKTSLAQGKVHHSSCNESHISKQSNKDCSSINIKHKNCLSCNSARPIKETKSKEDYKFAFKAGNPNSVQSVSSTDSKGIKIPKMRHPYTKKSYTIPTLAPPFSIWRDANATGYPEHWRLASVYQHAYKAPEQRRKPLIDSVYL